MPFPLTTTYIYSILRQLARAVVRCVAVGALMYGYFFALPAEAFISGTLYTDTGITTAPSGIAIGIAVSTSTNSVYFATTTSGGVWSLTGVATSSLSSTTPIVIWLEASSTDATTMVMGYGGTNITNVSLYYNDVVVSAAATSSTVTLSSFTNYDRDNDSDILFVTATSASSTVLFEDLFITRGTLRLPEVNTVLIGSFTNNATLTPSTGNFLTLSGTSETVSGSVTGISALGRVRVTGSYATPATASTTSLIIESGGSFTAPSNNLTVSGTFLNDGTFNNNNGTVTADGVEREIVQLLAGRESGLTTAGSNILSFTIASSTLYVGRAAYTGACVTTTGGNCELLIYDISSTTNPVLLGGRESGLTTAGAAINTFTIASSTLYVGRGLYTGACVTTTGEFCELLIYDISSTTNPVLLGGRESGLTTAGGNIRTLTMASSTLYVGRDAYTGACVTTTGEFCELLIYDISSTTNPVLLGGRESGTGSGGFTTNTLTIVGTTLYAGRDLYSGACVTTTGEFCELLIYDISSTTNPVLLGGRETGLTTAGSNVNTLTVVGTTLYIGRFVYSGACVTSTGEFCELLIYNISSTTNPVLLGGRESGLTTAGGNILTVTTASSTLYVGRVAYTGACVTTTGGNCELLIYNISSTTNPVLLGGRESGLTTAGGIIRVLATIGDTLYVGRDAYTGACVTTTGDGCEMLAYNTSLATVLLAGTFTGSSALNNVTTDGSVLVAANASTSILTVGAGTTTVTATRLSASNGFTNNGILSAQSLQELIISGGNYTNNGTASFDTTNTVLRFTGGSQTLSGALSSTSSLPAVQLFGTGTKTFASNATVTDLTIAAGVTVTAPPALTITDDFTNNGTYTSSSLLEVRVQVLDFLSSRESGLTTAGGAISVLATVGNTLYVGRAAYTGACVTTTGGNCELLIYDISSTTNPVLLGGRESGLTTAGAAINTFTIASSTLYVGRGLYTGACVTTTGEFCELLIYDISSTTNPVLLGGRESGLTTAGGNIRTLTMASSTLYVGRDAYTGACVTTTGGNCELLIYNISSTTNPVLLGGRETGLTTAGGNTFTLTAASTTLYVGRDLYTGACVTTTGGNCELLIYNISSTTNPVLLGGRESGLTTAGGAINVLTTVGTTLYVGRASYSGTCIITTGDLCELLMYEISSTTNPVLLGGREAGALNGSNQAVNMLAVSGSLLYAGLGGISDVCAPGSGEGCELRVYDISSTTRPVFRTGYEAGVGLGGSNVIALAAVGNTLYVGRAAYTGACVTTTGDGCELFIYEAVSNFSGTLTNTSALGNLTIATGTARVLANASTTNLTVTGSFVAPAHLSVAGSYTQSGVFTAASGTVYMSGTSQQVATGTLASSSAFHNLTISNTSGNGTTSQAVVFGAPIQTTGTFAMGASTSARFLANATNTFEAVNWNGVSAGTPVWLRSSATGTQWRFTTNNFVSTSHINVRDSFNGSVATATCSVGCTNAGNNTRWDFSTGTQPVAGTLTLAAHPSGQADNLFSFQNEVDGVLYRFSMTAATETAIVDDVVLSVFGLRGVDVTEVTDFRLYRDINSDGAVDGGDIQVLGPGIMAISGEAGTITFSAGTTSVATTTAQRYIVTADTVAIDNNDWLNVQLRSTGVVATGLTSSLPTTITGNVTSVQHIRSNAGGGGTDRSPIGGDAPAGAGVQGGGGRDGGGDDAEVGQLPEGDNITPDPDFFRPTTSGSPHNEWTGGTNAYASDGVYATAASANLRQTYGGFGLSIPVTNIIQGIQVKLDGSGTTAAGTIQVALSWDGGTTITTLEASPTLAGSDIVYTLGGQTNLWGRSWTATELNDANFRLRVVAQPSSNTVRLDAIEVRVFHVAGGGGQGGGGGAI